MKTDKLEYAYVILNKNHEFVDELGEVLNPPCCYSTEEKALSDLRFIYKKYPDEEGPFYIGKVTLVSKVYPPSDLRIEKL